MDHLLQVYLWLPQHSKEKAMILTTFTASVCFKMKMLCVLCDLGPKFKMFLRPALFFRGLNVLKSLHHVITIGFVEVDRVMCYGETKFVFGNNLMKVNKMNLCLLMVMCGRRWS